jgi:hypothetical protein
MVAGPSVFFDARGMRIRRTSIVASLVAAFALAAFASLAGGAASAQAYYLKNTDFGDFHRLLRFPPKHPKFRPCISNTVTLPRGTYDHGAYIVSQRHRTSPDLEGAGRYLTVRRRTTYNWEVCRFWNPDSHGNGLGFARYQVQSRLLRRGAKPHVALMTFENEPGGRRVIYGEGNYEWGGRIARACVGCTSPSD